VRGSSNRGAVPPIVKTLIKLAISVAILTYVVLDIQERSPDTFYNLLHAPKDWRWFAASLACYALALLIGLIRWQMIARVVQVDVSFKEILRIGSFAYMTEVVSIGLAGADAARATLMARAVPRRAGAVVTSVLVDRSLGGCVLFWLCSIAAWLVAPTDTVILGAVRTIQTCSALSLVGLVAWAIFPRLPAWVAERVRRFGSPGRFLAQLLLAVSAYRDRLLVLAIAVAMTACLLLLTVTSFFLLGQGLPGGAPSWTEHVMIVPLLLLSALVPLPMQGLGVIDYTLSYLYQHGSATPPPFGQGLAVAMAVRLNSIALALISGAIYSVLRPARSSESTDAAARQQDPQR